MKKNIAIFASGKGSNAKAILDFFKESKTVNVSLIVCNKADARVLEIAKENKISFCVLTKEDLNNENYLLPILKTNEIALIVLAGFLLLIPSYLVQHYSKKIINIHPALLPKYGGKGMYGMKVHEAVCANNDAITGITIHFVNEHYDEGEYILQKNVSLSKEDTPLSMSTKVQQLEHEWYPKAIESILL